MKKTLIAVLTALACAVGAQESQPTANLVFTNFNSPPAGAQFSWSGFEITGSGGGGLWGGHVPGYNPQLGQFMFGYMPATISYSLAVNSVLSGTGLKVSGIQYGLQYWNQDFSRGTLSTTVSLLGNNGTTLQSYYHSLPNTAQGWANFDQTKTFDSPYTLSNLGTVSMSFSGKDDRFWAGYYGPQFRNPYVRLTYAADAPPLPPPPPLPVVIPNTTTTTVQVTPTETVTTESITVISTPTVEIQQTTTTLTSTAAATSPTAAVATPTSAPAPVATRSVVPAGNSAAVSMVLRNNAAQQAALQSSNLTTSIQQSQSVSQDSGASSGATGSDSVSLGMSSFNTAARQQADSMSTMDAASPTSTRNLLNMMSTRPVDTEQQDREDRAARATAAQSSSSQSVGVDLGTGVSMAALAVVPTGYSAYSVQLITQVPFYPVKQVYLNQRTVDNARALRQLTNDSRHRDMVEQQYRR